MLILKNLVSIEDNTDHRNKYHKDPKRTRKMKKYNLTLLVILTIVSIALTACGASVANQAPVTTSVSAVATGEPTSVGLACAPNCQYSDLVVGFLQTGSEGGWRAANTASFKQTADELGLKLKFYDSQNDLARQVAGFQRLIQDPEVNVIILAALETTGWEEVLIQAQDAGKIVVIEDRRIDASEDLYATYIGSDFAEEGRKTATEMCKLLEGTAGKNVWELVGNIGSSAAKDRGEGFRELMSACGIEITKSQTANWSATEGKQVTEAWLKESTDVQGIFAQNDEMAFGAIEALQDAGLVPGVDVKIISVDATAGAFQAMLDGTLNVTVECNPLLAPQVYEAALKAANGESQPKWVPSQESVFFADDPNLQTIISSRTY
jgi:ABC-type sugar transport system substrate-binding protein